MQHYKLSCFHACMHALQSELTADKWVKDEQNSLAGLALHQFSCGVCVQNNGAVSVDLDMFNACLTDRRALPNKTLTRLVGCMV